MHPRSKPVRNEPYPNIVHIHQYSSSFRLPCSYFKFPTGVNGAGPLGCGSG